MYINCQSYYFHQERKRSYEACLVKSSLILQCCTNLYEKLTWESQTHSWDSWRQWKCPPNVPLHGSRIALNHHQACVITALPSVHLAARPLISYIIWLFRIPSSWAAWHWKSAALPGSWQRLWWTVWAGAAAGRRRGPEAELRAGTACWPDPGSPAAAAGPSPGIPEYMGSPAVKSSPGSPPGQSAYCSHIPGCCWSSCSQDFAPVPGTPRVHNIQFHSRYLRALWSGSVGKSGLSQKMFSTCFPKSKSSYNSHREGLI